MRHLSCLGRVTVLLSFSPLRPWNRTRRRAKAGRKDPAQLDYDWILNPSQALAVPWIWIRALRDTDTTPDQAAVLKRNLAQIILASACTGAREIEELKAIALKALG